MQQCPHFQYTVKRPRDSWIIIDDKIIQIIYLFIYFLIDSRWIPASTSYRYSPRAWLDGSRRYGHSVLLLPDRNLRHHCCCQRKCYLSRNQNTQKMLHRGNYRNDLIESTLKFEVNHASYFLIDVIFYRQGASFSRVTLRGQGLVTPGQGVWPSPR